MYFTLNLFSTSIGVTCTNVINSVHLFTVADLISSKGYLHMAGQVNNNIQTLMKLNTCLCSSYHSSIKTIGHWNEYKCPLITS
jgi:hypothetical protein